MRSDRLLPAALLAAMMCATAGRSLAVAPTTLSGTLHVTGRVTIASKIPTADAISVTVSAVSDDTTADNAHNDEVSATLTRIGDHGDYAISVPYRWSLTGLPQTIQVQVEVTSPGAPEMPLVVLDIALPTPANGAVTKLDVPVTI